MQPHGVHHTAILVRDLAGMEGFYREVLGLPLLRRWPAPEGGGDRSVWLDLGGGAFLALEATCAPDDDGRGHDRPGYHLMALGISQQSRADWEQRLADAGHPVYRRTDYTIYVRDPEGNRIGLSHYPSTCSGCSG